MNKKLPLQGYVTTFALKNVNKSAMVLNKLMKAGWKPSRRTVRTWLNLPLSLPVRH